MSKPSPNRTRLKQQKGRALPFLLPIFLLALSLSQPSCITPFTHVMPPTTCMCVFSHVPNMTLSMLMLTLFMLSTLECHPTTAPKLLTFCVSLSLTSTGHFQQFALIWNPNTHTHAHTHCHTHSILCTGMFFFRFTSSCFVFFPESLLFFSSCRTFLTELVLKRSKPTRKKTTTHKKAK